MGPHISLSGVWKLMFASVLIIFLSVQVTSVESCIKVVEESHSLPIVGANITINDTNCTQLYLENNKPDKDGIAHFNCSGGSLLNYNYFLSINPKLTVHKTGYYSYYGDAIYYPPIIDESLVVKQPYLIADGCLTIRLKSEVRLEVKFQENFNVNVIIDNKDIGSINITTNYFCNSTKNFSYIKKRGEILVYGLSLGKHNINLTPIAPKGYDSVNIPDCLYGDTVINVQFKHKKSDDGPFWGLLGKFGDDISKIFHSSPGTNATDKESSDFFFRLLPALILTASLWLYLSSHIFREKRFKDLEGSFILASAFFIFSILTDIIAIFLDSVARTNVANVMLLFLIILFYFIGWIFVFDFIWSMRTLFLQGPMIYVSLITDRFIRAPYHGFINDVWYMWKIDKKWTTLMIVLVAILVFAYLVSLENGDISAILCIWVMFILFVGILGIYKLLSGEELWSKFRTAPRGIPIVMVPVIFPLIITLIIVILYGSICLVSLFIPNFILNSPIPFSAEIPLEIFGVFFVLFFCSIIIKTLIVDILTLNPFKAIERLRRPDEFIKNHEDTNLFYYYGKNYTIQCNRGQTVFCIGESRTAPFELANQFTLDGLRNGEYCTYIASARDVETIINQLSKKKEEIENKALELYRKQNNATEIDSFNHTMRICRHDDYVKSVIKEMVIDELIKQPVKCLTERLKKSDERLLGSVVNDVCSEKISNIIGWYLFSWNDLPGNDTERLKEYLRNVLKIEWVKNAEIKKTDENKTINVINKDEEKNSITLKLNKEENKVTLKIGDGKIYEYDLKDENGKQNIYIGLNGLKDALTFEIKHNAFEEYLRKKRMYQIRNFDLKDFIRKLVKEINNTNDYDVVENELSSLIEQFVKDQNEAKLLVEILMFEVEYAISRKKDKYREEIDEKVDDIVECISLNLNEVEKITSVSEINKKIVKFWPKLNDGNEKNKLVESVKTLLEFLKDKTGYKLRNIESTQKNTLSELFEKIFCFKMNNWQSIKKLIDILKFKKVFENEYCIFKFKEFEDKKIKEKFEEMFSEITKKIRNVTINEDFFNNNNIEKILKFKKENNEEIDEIRKKIDEIWINYFKDNLKRIKENNYKNYLYYYEQYRELSRLRWFFSDIEDYTKEDMLIMIDAFIEYKGMREKERFYRRATGNKDIIFKGFWYKITHIPGIGELWYDLRYKDKIVVRKYDIKPGDVSSLHRCIRTIRNHIFTIRTKSGVCLEEYCNHRRIFNMFSDFFEVADENHLLQLVHHNKLINESNNGGLEFITIKPDDFARLQFLYRTLDDLGTVVGDIYFALEDSKKNDPKARVRIIKHHNRDEETKEGDFYDLCEKHGWLYLEGCEHEEEKVEKERTKEILKKISRNGRLKLVQAVRSLPYSKKKDLTERLDEEVIEEIRDILQKEDIVAGAIELLVRRIIEEPEEFLKDIEEIAAEKPEEELHEEHVKEAPEGVMGKEPFFDMGIFSVMAAAGTYVLIEEIRHLFGL